MTDLIPLTVSNVEFHGDTLEAVELEGKVWVSVRRVCQALGLHLQAQLEKLKEKCWATIRFIRTVAQDGKQREVTMIDLDRLPMWLATVEISRVSPSVRDKLEQYQNECAQVLRNHFFGKPVDPIMAVLESAKQMRLEQIDLRRKTAEARRLAKKANRTAEAALATAESNYGYYSVLAFAKLQDRELTYAEAARHGKALTAICREKGIEVRKMRDPRFGKVNLYPESVLKEFFGCVQG